MPEVSHRIAGLSDNRRLLLERLLAQKGKFVAVEKQNRSTSRPDSQPDGKTTTALGEHRFEPFSLGEVKASYERFYDAVNNQPRTAHNAAASVGTARLE